MCNYWTISMYEDGALKSGLTLCCLEFCKEKMWLLAGSFGNNLLPPEYVFE